MTPSKGTSNVGGRDELPRAIWQALGRVVAAHILMLRDAGIAADRPPLPRAIWQALGRVVAAHILMLRDAGIAADQTAAAALTPIDGLTRGAPPSGVLGALVVEFDRRLDALVAPAARGTATLGRGRADTEASAARLVVRRGLLDLGDASAGLRTSLIDLAVTHAATTMPVFAPDLPPQATTFGHFLGGLIGPLERAALRAEAALDSVNLSPMGAAALTSTALPISRERVAALLGFAALVENTLDAVAATDHLVDAASAAGAVAGLLRRFVEELLVWLRTDPDSLKLGDGWTTTDPAFPGLSTPTGLIRLVAMARSAEAAASEAASRGREAAFTAVGSDLDGLLAATFSAISTTVHLVDEMTSLLKDGLEVNLAYLANRAGKGFTTASDLTTLLMNEENLDPVSAASIAALTVARARAEGIEISGITSPMIDGAALLTIGRELAVEFEAISRYLAPRRYLERRHATGGPAPAAVRAAMERARRRFDRERQRRAALIERLSAADAELARLVDEAVGSTADH